MKHQRKSLYGARVYYPAKRPGERITIIPKPNGETLIVTRRLYPQAVRNYKHCAYVLEP